LTGPSAEISGAIERVAAVTMEELRQHAAAAGPLRVENKQEREADPTTARPTAGMR
jgi:hypothetical protein